MKCKCDKDKEAFKLVIAALKDIRDILNRTDEKLEKIIEDKEGKDWLERIKNDIGKVKSTEVFLRTIINKNYAKNGLDCYS